MDKIKLGIIGIGNQGTGYSKKLSEGEVPEIELVAVADRREARRDWCKENLPESVTIFEEGKDLIASGLCDAVAVVVPHYQHPELVIDALEHGQHVICDKPAGVYTKQVREMNEAAAKSDKVFAMMFNQRTNCVYRKMHELVAGGELGPVRRVNWIITDWYRTQSYYDSGSWRATWEGEGGGVLLNQCPHNLDISSCRIKTCNCVFFSCLKTDIGFQSVFYFDHTFQVMVAHRRLRFNWLLKPAY